MTTLFVRAANPIWYMVDHIGQPLNDEYYAFFLTNDLPYIPQLVTHDPEGLIPWSGDIVQFQPSGTLPNNLYFDPSLTYRIEVRHGNTQADELIWEINNFIPGDGNSINNVNDFSDGENMITNPQFEEIGAVTVFATAGTYPIAPGWDLVLTGVGGTTTISQLQISGLDASGSTPPVIVGNPPYALTINQSGWSSCILRQRFNENGAIFCNGAIAMNITARATTNPLSVTLNYHPSSPGVPVEIKTGTIAVGSFAILSGAVDLPGSANNNTGVAAYVDIEIEIPGTAIIDITNVQVVGQSIPLSAGFDPDTDIPLFQEQTIERDIDHRFHLYKDGLVRRPAPSLLTGWDFPLNPAQRGTAFGPSAAGANTSFYSWDQTIVFQSVNSGLTTSRVTNNLFSISASVASQAALIQYLPATQARVICGNLISAYLQIASLAAGNIPDPLKITVSLWSTTDASLPSIASNNSLVATLDANGKPATFHGNWIEITPVNSEDATFTQVTDDVALDGWWHGNAQADTATFFAIVIGTATMPANNSLVFSSVSLQKGSIGSPPSAQTPDDVLRECQAYWEQSYAPGVAVGTVTTLGRQTNLQNWLVNGGNIATKPGPFYLKFKSVKNTAPTMAFYAPSSGTVNTVDINLWNGGTIISSPNPAFSTNWVLAEAASTDGANYSPNSFTTLSNPAAVETGTQSTMLFHYTADSRLGA